MLLPELNLPIGFAGKDGFYWWIGQVETEDTYKNSNRYKVRIVGQHVKSCTAVPVDDLPWAVIMLPVTQPSREGNSDYSPAKLIKGDWVVGFFMDGAAGQQPIIMGTLQKVTDSSDNQSLTNVNVAGECLAFSRYVADTNPKVALPKDNQENATARPGNDANNSSAPGSSAVADGTNGEQTVTNPHGRYACLQTADPTCTDTGNQQSKFEQTLSEFFASVSNNGGQIGSKMLSDVTGKLVDYSGAAQGYINRIFGLCEVYVKNLKYELLKAIKKGIQEILSFCLGIPIPDANKKAGGSVVKNKNSGVLAPVIKWLTDQLGLINCTIEGLAESIFNFLTDLIYNLLTKVVSSATCLIESLISQVLSELENFLTSILSELLGPLTAILDIIASPLNILGTILSYIFDLFGIKCTGPKNCSTKETAVYCTGPAGTKKKPGEDDFKALDDMIAEIENDGVADLQSSCTDYYTLPCPVNTTADIYGGIPDEDNFTGDPEDPPLEIDDPFDNFFNDFIQDPDEPGTDTPDIEDDFVQPVDLDILSITSLSLENDSVTSYSFNRQYTYESKGKLKFNQNIVDDNLYSFVSSTGPTPFIIAYTLERDKSRVSQNQTIRMTLRCISGTVPNGTKFNYFIFGRIQLSDFVDGTNVGQITMVDNVAHKNITLSSKLSIEKEEDVLFSVIEAGVSKQFTIFQEGYVPPTVTRPPTFRPPVIDDPEVDNNGKIIDIPIKDPGDPYIKPPFIKIFGEGVGASASALLDDRGFLKKIIIQRPGGGYTPSRRKSNCVLDGFTIIRPGLNYTSEPIVVVNGELGIAKAIITNGIVTGLELLNKSKTYNIFPSVQVLGGGGYGTKVIPSLSCVNDDVYRQFSNAVAPSGEAQVIDCP